jgi:hypothetical protein
MFQASRVHLVSIYRVPSSCLSSTAVVFTNCRPLATMASDAGRGLLLKVTAFLYTLAKIFTYYHSQPLLPMHSGTK